MIESVDVELPNKLTNKIPYENEFMTQCLESIPVYDQKIEREPDFERISRTEEDTPESPKIRTHKSGMIKTNNTSKRKITNS